MTQMTLSSKGRITIPKVMRDSLQLHAGDKIEVVLTPQNEIILRPPARKVDDVFVFLAKYKKRVPVSVEEMSLGRIRE